MFLITKALETFASPVGLMFPGGLVLLVLLVLGFRRLAIGTVLLGLGVLWISSAPVMARTLARWLEHQVPPVSVSASPTADAIVVLGGGVVVPGHAGATPQMGGNGDRLLHAIELYRARKARFIVVSGGPPGNPGGPPTEAELMREVLLQVGVPTDAVLVEDRSRTTQENAAYSVPLMRQAGLSSALLVTSAIHMPRALATFRATGLDVIPSPADYVDHPSDNPPLLDWLPDPEALMHFNASMHEIVGYLYYHLRGWA